MLHYQLVLLSLILVNINNSDGYQGRLTQSRRLSRDNGGVQPPTQDHYDDDKLARDKLYQNLLHDLEQLISKRKTSRNKDNGLTAVDMKANIMGNPVENDPSASKFYTFTKSSIDHPKPFTWTDVLTAQLIQLMSGPIKPGKETLQVDNNCKSHRDLFSNRPLLGVHDRSCMPRLCEELNSELEKRLRDEENTRPNSCGNEIKDKLTSSWSSDLNSDYFARHNNLFKKILLEKMNKVRMHDNDSKSNGDHFHSLENIPKSLMVINASTKDEDSLSTYKNNFNPSYSQGGQDMTPRGAHLGKVKLESTFINTNIRSDPKIASEYKCECNENSLPRESHIGCNEYSNNSSQHINEQNKFYVKLPALSCMNKTVTTTKSPILKKTDFIDNYLKTSNVTKLQSNIANSLNNPQQLCSRGSLNKLSKNIHNVQLSKDFLKSLPDLLEYAVSADNLKDNFSSKLSSILSSVVDDHLAPLLNDGIIHKCKSSKGSVFGKESKKNLSFLLKEVRQNITLPEYEKMDHTVANEVKPNQEKKNETGGAKKPVNVEGHWLAKLPLMEFLCHLVASNKEAKLEEAPTTHSHCSDEAYLVIPISNTNFLKANFKNKAIKREDANKCFSNLSNNILKSIINLNTDSRRVKKSTNNIINTYFKKHFEPSHLKDDDLSLVKSLNAVSSNTTNLPKMTTNKSFGTSATEIPELNQTQNTRAQFLENIPENQTSVTPRDTLQKKLSGLNSNVEARAADLLNVTNFEAKVTSQQDKTSNIFISQNQSQHGSVAISISPDNQNGPASVSIHSNNPVNTSISHNSQFMRTGKLSILPGTSSITINHPQNLINPISINVSSNPSENIQSNNQHIHINISHIPQNQFQPNQLQPNKVASYVSDKNR